MFSFLKRNFKLVAPIDGKVISLDKVPDEIFSQKMAGDGVAIETSGDLIVAPADGELTFIFKTNHAFGISLNNGVELLIHIGIDTVNLAGEGFERLVHEGQSVKAGEPIIRIKRDFILERGCSLISPILITNADSVNIYNMIINKQVKAGKDIILEYKLK
jgi:PTS system D-glucosamine-specific IIA component/PTS system glucose-specific IIA component